MSPQLLPSHTKILVVGCGPTGLATSISLIKHGVQSRDIVLVDRALRGENTSRAVVIHAATLEDLNTIGCATELISRGLKGTRFQFQNRSGSPIFRLEFSSLAPYTDFPCFLSIPQTITEYTLEEQVTRLGVEMYRPFTVVGMKTSASGEGLDVLFDSGEVITANFVVGADGSKSAVRRLSGIEFQDTSGALVDSSLEEPMQSVLADVSFSVPPSSFVPAPDGTVFATIGPGGLCVLFGFRPDASSDMYDANQPTYRLVFLNPLFDAPSRPPIETLQKYLDNWGPTQLTSGSKHTNVSKVYWSNRFRHRSALAEVFYRKMNGNGRVFLVGDAAHIHSPVGGQGMNLGLRDAISLGALVAEQIEKHNFDENLEQLAKRRREKALHTIFMTKRLTRMEEILMTYRLARWIFKYLSFLPFVGKLIVWRMSGLDNR